MEDSYFVHQNGDTTFKLLLCKNEAFRAIRIKILNGQKLVFSTPKMNIAKPVLENFIHSLQQGNPFYGNTNIPFAGSKNNSYLVLYDAYRSMLGRVTNELTNSQHNFDIKGIDPKELAAYLIKQMAVVV